MAQAYYHHRSLRPALAAGGVAPSFSLLQDDSAGTFTSATTVSVGPFSNIQSDSLIVAFVVWQSTATCSVRDAVSGGGNLFTSGTVNDNTGNNGTKSQFFWQLPGDTKNSGTVTYEATFSASSAGRAIFVFEFEATGTVALDQQAVNTGTGATRDSGNITTTESVTVWLGGCGDGNNTGAISSPLLDAVAATFNTGGAINTCMHSWYKTFAASGTGSAAATGESTDWNCNVVAFKAT